MSFEHDFLLIDWIATLDLRDVFYATMGLALMGLTLQPAIKRFPLINLPLIYVLFGALGGVMGLPFADPRNGGLETSIIEHISELIVIISLAGAGLAIDEPMRWRTWHAAFRLILVAMPLTIIAVVWVGGLLGLSLAGALLLAAALAPTDPVLARSVQVSPPGKEETPMEVSLTAEAGLNDGLAFPFVYLAITTAMVGWGQGWFPDWGVSWLAWDVAYRIGAAIVVGVICGWFISALALSGWGDATHGAWNSIVMVLASTLLSYGAAEAVDGYGFLAVFVCARAGKARSRRLNRHDYEKFVHHGADQLESILLAFLLLWLGAFIGGGALDGLTLMEVGFAVALIFVIRPVSGFLALIGVDCERMSRSKVAFFGVRGMGSVFYIAYAQTHADFADMDTVWRIAAITILISIAVHGFAANFVLNDEEDAAEEEHPYRERLAARQAAE